MSSPYYDQVDALLSQVTKPSRYLGCEVNAVHKDLDRVALKFALAFPDTYEIGMSHLGFRIIYHLLNRREQVAAERFFCPWTDMESLMRQRGIPLFSQESRTPLSGFDVIGFSISYEMGYSNVLNMLDLGGIPFESEARATAFPLVIGGGPCTVNPEPLACFFDAFVVGDGEEVLEEIVDVALQAKTEAWGKRQLLETLACLEGVYIPSFFRVTYGQDGDGVSISSTLNGHERISRRIVARMDPLAYPTDVVVPFTRVVHDRVSLEIARGCTRGCRFCQAGFTYRPVRERSLNRILELSEASLRSSGYEELSLLSLSAGDYSGLKQLVKDLTIRYAPEKVALSFPSLRIGSLSDEIMEMIKEVRKTGITLAPEAGTERLRLVINKDVGEEEVLETARRVFQQGWLSLKLYFMIGLPTETQEDLEGIVRLCEKILKEMGARRARKKLSVSLSTFVPKPHTPFQWATQLSLDETHKRLGWLRRYLRRKGIQVKWQDPRLSLLEGAFSRGDRRLSRVLLRAHALGCRFDGWGDHFQFEHWQRAFDDCEIPLEAYVNRARSPDEALPWSHIDVGVSQEYLREEYQRAMAGQRTADCRDEECQGCAVCDFERLSVVLAKRSQEALPFPGMKAFQGVYHRSRGRDVHRKFRVQYAKKGSARFLSHLELNTIIIRALRRAEIPLRFSEGYHPMPRIDFGPALPVGVESLAEFFDFDSFGYLDASEVREKLQASCPKDIVPISCQEIPYDTPSLFKESARIHYRIEIPEEMGWSGEILEARIEDFRQRPTCVIRRQFKGKVRELDAKAIVKGVEVRPPRTLLLTVHSGPEGGVRLLEVVGTLLGLAQEEVRRLRILKTEVEFVRPST